MATTRLISKLEAGQPATLNIYGTSLSFHLAPLLRDALVARYGELITVQNMGISGRASRTGLQELENRVLSRAPDALLVEFAVNDAHSYDNHPEETLDRGITLEESRRNLETLIDHVQRALPDCEIILQTMNPTYDSPRNDALGASRRSQLEAFYQGYRDVAVARGLKLIDNHRFWQTLRSDDAARFEALVPDGVHPSPTAIRTVLVPHLLEELGVETTKTFHGAT